MKHKLLVMIALCGMMLGIALLAPQVEAQVQGEWSQPYRLSTGRGKASEAGLATDAYGYVHAFWSEQLADQSSILYYARFDGGGWTTALDLYRSRPFVPIQSISPVVDRKGVLHVAWSTGDNGPMQYMQTPAAGALSSTHWPEPVAIKLPGKQVRLAVGDDGALHLLYSRTFGQARGVFYTRSTDEAKSWSQPRWLDPDSLPGYSAGSIQFQMDEEGGLHALWFYAGLETQGGNWVRYAHSLNGGETWSLPFTIDKYVEGSDYTLDFAYPIMAVAGQSVHVVWGGGSLHYRNHRYSTDAGRSWSPATRIFGELNGQAFEGLTVDGLGRIHYLGHIRYPMAIYHAIWENGQWTRPALVYLISLSADDPIGERVHAHYTLATVRAGNQLVLTFTDSPPEPERRLFTVHRSLPGIEPFTPMPTPTATAMPEATATATATAVAPTPTATPAAAALEAIAALPPGSVTRPDRAVWAGMLLPLLLLAGTLAIWLLSRHRKESAR
jgi:hypothetical protein